MPFAYKMLNPGRIAPVQGSFVYPEIGKWTKKIAAKDLLMCHIGYHVARTPAEVLAHLATDVYLCEYDGETVEGSNKLLVQRVKLVKQVMGQREWVLFAADCAERVLANFESVFPNDDRPRKAIEAARAFALDPSQANRDAAESAAESAGYAAESAGYAGYAGYAARYAGYAAGYAERTGGYARLQQYLDGTINTNEGGN